VFDLADNSIIHWAGWETTWQSLRAEGWVITIKPKYSNWRQPYCSAASREKVYIRHPQSRQLGRITGGLQVDGRKYWELDYLIQECNHRVKPQRITDDGELSIDDIPHLMNLILNLQPKTKRKKSTIIEKQAEILLLRKTA
jgi:hypothetical protein